MSPLNLADLNIQRFQAREGSLSTTLLSDDRSTRKITRKRETDLSILITQNLVEERSKINGATWSLWCGGRRNLPRITLPARTGFGTRRESGIKNEKGIDRDPRTGQEIETGQEVKKDCLVKMSSRLTGVETWTGRWTEMAMDTVAEIDKENEAEMGIE